MNDEQDLAIMERVKRDIANALEIYDRTFLRSEKPTEREVVALIAQTLASERARISLAVQMESLLGELRTLEMKVDLLK